VDTVLQQIIDMLIKLKRLDAELASSSTGGEPMVDSRESNDSHHGGVGENRMSGSPVLVHGQDGRATNEIRDDGLQAICSGTAPDRDTASSRPEYSVHQLERASLAELLLSGGRAACPGMLPVALYLLGDLL
jgi:hypothetical protein